MNEYSEPKFLNRVLLIVLTVVGLVSFWWMRSIWILAFASIVIAVGISVPARWLQQHGFSRSLAIVISAIGVIVGVVAIMLLLVLPISSEVGRALESAPAAIDSAAQLYDEWRTVLPFVANLLPERESSDILIQLGELAAKVDLSTFQDAVGAVFQAGSTVLPSLIKGLGTFLGLLANVLLVVFIAIFFLVEPMSYVKASLYITPETYHEKILRVWSELYQTLSAWITTQFLAISITMALVWTVLGFLLQIPGAMTISLFAGFATFIPNIGAVLPIIPIIFFILVDGGDNQSTQLLQAIPAYLALQFVEGSIITPRLMKAQLNIPSGALMLFQVISASIFGALGLIFAVPILATVVTLVRELFSYGVLGLRDKPIEIVTLDAQGTLSLKVNPSAAAEQEQNELDREAVKLEREERVNAMVSGVGGFFQELGNLSLWPHRSNQAVAEPTQDEPFEAIQDAEQPTGESIVDHHRTVDNVEHEKEA